MPEMKVSRPDPGEQLPFLNAPSDVNTVLVDGIGTVQSNVGSVKVGFVETITGPDGPMGVRYVVNLAFNRAELARLRDVITDVMSVIDANETANG